MKQKTIVVIGLILLILIGWASQFFLGNDNPIEQIAEKSLNQILEVDIDFSP